MYDNFIFTKPYFFIQAYNSFQKDEVLTDAGFNRPKVSIQQIPLSQ